MNLKIYKLYENAHTPQYGTANAACFDLSAFIEFQTSAKLYTKDNKEVTTLATQDENGNNIQIPPEWRALIPTGLIFDIPDNHSVRIYPRSGISTKKGLNLINCVGIIDADYVHQVYIPVYNNSQERIKIYNGDRIAQAEMVVNHQIEIHLISERPEKKSDRNGGFGSTGV